MVHREEMTVRTALRSSTSTSI